MAIYNISGDSIQLVYNFYGSVANELFNIHGDKVYTTDVDYSNYSFVQKWASKGISSTQGFDIYDGKVFWVSKSGNSSIPANCYVWNLSDGSQALDTPYISIYSGHGNNLSFDFPKLYASTAYPPSSAYVNTLTSSFVASLEKTLVFNDGSTDCDVCVDELNKNILWTLGHTAGSSDTSAPFYISKWDLTNLTDNGDGTFTPLLLNTTQTPQPTSSYFFQGCKIHNGILWFASGYGGGATNAYVFAVDPMNGNRLYTIDCNTTEEPEGISWVADETSLGGFALYVGFAGMMLRKYIFSS